MNNTTKKWKPILDSFGFDPKFHQILSEYCEHHANKWNIDMLPVSMKLLSGINLNLIDIQIFKDVKTNSISFNVIKGDNEDNIAFINRAEKEIIDILIRDTNNKISVANRYNKLNKINGNHHRKKLYLDLVVSRIAINDINNIDFKKNVKFVLLTKYEIK